MFEVKIIAKPWSIIRCENGHPQWIATKEVLNFIKPADVATTRFNYYKLSGLVAIGNHHPDYEFECECGACCYTYNYDRTYDVYVVTPLHHNKMKEEIRGVKKDIEK